MCGANGRREQSLDCLLVVYTAKVFLGGDDEDGSDPDRIHTVTRYASHAAMLGVNH